MEQSTDAGEEAPVETVEAEAEEEIDMSHLEGIEDGCGCAEVWEHLSESREATPDVPD